MKGVLFLQNGMKKGKGSDLGAEPSRIKFYLVPKPPPPPPPGGFNVTNPQYNEPISPVPWHFVK